MIKAVLDVAIKQLKDAANKWVDEELNDQAFLAVVGSAVQLLETVSEQVAEQAAAPQKAAVPDHRHFIEEAKRKLREERALKDPDSVEGVDTMRAVEVVGTGDTICVPSSMPQGAYMMIYGERYQLSGNALVAAPEKKGGE